MNWYGEEAYRAPQKTVRKRLAEGLMPLWRLLSLVVLVIYAPLIIVLAVAILATSPGPAFVRKAYRRGSGTGQLVYLYEFRTECWHTWCETPVGAFLRRSDLYRLPRLANVLMGQIVAGERVQRVGE
ncbi:MAG TPA: sugar transferase [Chthonomonadaceae bacterium]|nr:sugar transferase [Chthonomonadaceae bacterium]